MTDSPTDVPIVDDSIEMRTCIGIRCEDRILPINQFKITGYHCDGSPSYANLCKKCRNKQQQLRIRLSKENAHLNNGICYICGKEGKLECDHNDVTEQFRGWICRSHNIAIGILNHDLNEIALCWLFCRLNGTRVHNVRISVRSSSKRHRIRFQYAKKRLANERRREASPRAGEENQSGPRALPEDAAGDEGMLPVSN